MFVFALCKVQTVGFEKQANAFDNDAMAASNLRRIQRFIAHYALDTDLIARLIFALLPAFVWCYKAGIFIHENIRKIKVKKHARKAKSIFKCGLSYIAGMLLSSKNQDNTNIVNFLSCT